MSDIAGLFDHQTLTRTASADEIAAVEVAIGALPPCYKAFARRFGYGTTNGLFVIEMPFSMFGDDGLLIRSIEQRDQVRRLVDEARQDGIRIGDADCLEPCDEEGGDVARFFHDLRFYGRGINGEYLCWRRNGAGGFAFHVIDRACLSIRFAGTSMIDFIRRTRTSDVKRLLGPGYAPLPSSFEGAKVERGG